MEEIRTLIERRHFPEQELKHEEKQINTEEGLSIIFYSGNSRRGYIRHYRAFRATEAHM